MKNFKTALTTGLLTVLPALGLAQGAPVGGISPTQVGGIQNAPAPVTNIAGIIRIFNTVINYFFTFLLILATIFVFVAAFKYLTAAGDDEKVKSAHHTIIYAAVAIAVALLAQGIRFIVAQLVGTTIQ